MDPFIPEDKRSFQLCRGQGVVDNFEYDVFIKLH